MLLVERIELLKETMSRLESRCHAAAQHIPLKKQKRSLWSLGSCRYPSSLYYGRHGGLVYNIEELRVVASRDFIASRPNPCGGIGVAGKSWMSVQTRKPNDYSMFIENIDPMGVHISDSICAPMLTISAELQNRLQEYAYKIVEAIEVIGGTRSVCP